MEKIQEKIKRNITRQRSVKITTIKILVQISVISMNETKNVECYRNKRYITNTNTNPQRYTHPKNSKKYIKNAKLFKIYKKNMTLLNNNLANLP